MFAAALAFVFITAHVSAKIPSYIHVCGRRDPNLDQCILNNLENLKDKICNGFPELNISSNNPLHLNHLVIFDSSGTKLYLDDVKVMGLCNYVVNFFHIDIDKLHFDIDLLYKKIRINGTYDFNIHLLVPISNKAQISINSDNVGAKVNVDMKLVTKNNQKLVFISKMMINLDIKGYNVKFSEEANLSQLREIINTVLGNNQKEIIRSFKPTLEETISKRIVSMSNDLVKYFTYDELFPDRI